MAKVTVLIEGDERGLKKSVDRAVKEMSRLEKAVAKSANPQLSNQSQFNNLSRQQFAEVQRIAKERARLQEISARRESALAVQSARQRAQTENNVFKSIEAARRRDFSEYQRIERQKTAIANAEARKRQSFTQNLGRLGGGLQSAGQGLQTGGATLTATVTAPLVALATLGIKSALELDKARTKLAALEGDAVKANARMQQLFDLADRSVGVTRAAAVETFTQLKGIGGIADETINQLIGSLGKLNAAFNIDDQAGFIRNLTQIFSQGFERSDIKEAIGRVPFFEQLLEQAFGTKDAAKLKQLKEAGKLTLNEFLTGLSNAVNTDPRIANVGENLTVKFAKGMERIGQSLAPIGDVILSTIVPMFERLAPVIQQASDYFKSLSPGVQTAIVAFGAFAAAAGPVLIILGAIVSAIGTLISAIGTIATAVGGFAILAKVIAAVGIALAATAVQFAPLIAGAIALYAAFQTNFGGLRDFVLNVFAGIQKIVATAMAEIRNLTDSVLKEIAQFWQANGEDIMTAVRTVSGLLENLVASMLRVLVALWQQHGDEIKAVVSAAWAAVKTIVIAGVQIVLNVAKLVAALINGDWAKAWDALKGVVAAAWNAVKSLVIAGAAILQNTLKGIVTFLFTLPPQVLQAGIDIGSNIVQGIKNGIANRTDEIKAAIYNLTVVGMIKNARSFLQTQSPSKVFDEIGQNAGEGLAQGIEKKVKRVQSAARRMAAEAVKELRDALKEFSRFAGASPETVANLQQADRTRQAAQSQREILDLRKELGVGFGQGLPSTVSGTEDEIAALLRQKKAVEDLDKSYEKLRDDFADLQDATAKYNEDVEKRLEAMRTTGEISLLDLHEQIDLEGVLDENQRRQIENLYEIERLRIELRADGYGEAMIAEAVEIAKAQGQQRAELEKILSVRKQVASAESLGKGLADELENLQRGGRELTEYERVLRQINTDYKDISDSQKEYLLNMARQIDAQRKFNEQYAETFNFIRDAFDILTEEGQSFGDRIKNLFKSIADRFKQMVLDMAATWLTNKIFGSGQGGFNLGGLFGGGSGVGGTPNFNPNAQGGGGFLSQLFGLVSGGGRSSSGGLPVISNQNILQAAGFGGGQQQQGGFLSQLFGRGGIFGQQGFGNNVGTFGGIGAIAGIAGGAIGGKFGSVLSSVGSGLATGAAIGSIIPGIGTAIGAAIGAAVGFFSSIFGSPKQKKDKNENLPALQQGFTEALAALRALAANKKAIQQDPTGAVTQAEGLRQQIASGFGIQFASSKYKKVAQQQIQARLAEADQLISQIKAFAKQAEAASLRPILPEFQEGYAVSSFSRRNGMLSGGIYGKDSLPALLMPGEMVINERQQNQIRRMANFDVFAYADIPNYTKPKRMATGGVVGAVASVVSATPNIEVNPNFNITFIEREDGNVDAYLDTERGRKKIKVAFQRLKKDREI